MIMGKISMRKLRIGILMVLALLTTVSVVSAALPAPVKADIDYSFNYHHYWIVDVITGPPELPPGTGYNSWCSDMQHTMSDGIHWFTAYSSVDPNLASQYTGPTEDWNKVNWIINNKNANPSITQAAIWHYDGAPPGDPHHSTIGSYTHSDYQAYIDLVDLHAGFVPTCGQLYAVILYNSTNPEQVIFVEMPLTTCPNPGTGGTAVPEFPSLALPAGMIIGMVGFVYFIKVRDNQ